MAAADFQPGAVLNDTWRLERVLGEGGIGRVFAEAYIREGARVAIGDINLAAAEQTAKQLGSAASAWVRVRPPRLPGCDLQ